MSKEKTTEEILERVRLDKLYKFRDTIFAKQDRIKDKINNLKLELFIIHCNLHPIGEEDMNEDELKNHLLKVNAIGLEKSAAQIRHKIVGLNEEYKYLIPAGSKIILDDERNALLADKTFEWW